jgi:hypothetical protein
VPDTLSTAIGSGLPFDRGPAILSAQGDLLPQKITFREMRVSGVREVLIYCRDCRCSHHVETSGDRWGDDVRLSDIERGFVRTACVMRGADVRPKFPQARMGIG